MYETSTEHQLDRLLTIESYSYAHSKDDGTPCFACYLVDPYPGSDAGFLRILSAPTIEVMYRAQSRMQAYAKGNNANRQA